MDAVLYLMRLAVEIAFYQKPAYRKVWYRAIIGEFERSDLVVSQACDQRRLPSFQFLIVRFFVKFQLTLLR